MKMKWGIIAGVLGGIAAAEAGGSAYFYRRTMMRYNAKKERTMKIFGMGMPELILILVVVLIIFGPKNLPKLGGMLGRSVKKIRGRVEDDDVDAAPGKQTA